MDRAVMKALAKVPSDRFGSADEFATALTAEVTESDDEKKSIVVLPFENLSPDPDNAFFADGLTEELIAELSGLKELRVISRTSAMKFKDSKKDVPTIARELNVRYVLEGSVRRAGDSVRITAQLIDAESDSHLWAERYTGKLDDIFDLQEQLSRRIVEALHVTLTPDDHHRLASRPISDVHAYDTWLRAQHEIYKFSKEGFDRGIQLIRQAQNITGENALLHAALGYAHVLSYDFGIRHDPGTLERADEHAAKALELNPNLGLALHAKGYVRFKHGDFEGMVRLLKSAVERDHSTDALAFLGYILAVVGRIDEAREAADEAVAQDPLYMIPSFTRACVDFFDGQFDAASLRYRKVLDDLAPGLPIVSWWLARAMAHCGRLDEAREMFAKVTVSDAPILADSSELFCRAMEGNRLAVTKLIGQKTMLVETAKADEVFPNLIANCLMLVGDEDGALEWLGRGIHWGACNYRYLEEYNPFLKPLHGKPRFQQLVEEARQKHEAFDA
jgi:TolB-like protein/tetratricopeptide (TPR) repeat protein